VEVKGEKPETKFYTLKQGIQSANGNYLFRIKNKIILTTENGIFEYNESSDNFEPSVFYNNIFGKKNIRYLKEDDTGNTWFVFDKILGVLDMSSGKPLIIYFPELTNKFVSGFEHIYPVNKNNIFIGGERGFYHINYEQYKTIKYPLQVQITAVKAINKKDSLLFGGYATDANEAPSAVKSKRSVVSHSWNSFHFEFASPVYAQQANIEYSYFLEGFDEKWSEFSSKTEKEYTNVPAGNYSFKVKVRNNLGNESEPVSYSFSVLPPWYLTRWAYAFYLCLFLLGAYGLYRYLKNKFRNQQKRHEEEQKRLQYLHQLEMEKTDKEIVKLKNEKLEAEIQHKNTELASVAMHLVQKGEMLAKIKEQIEHLKNKPGDAKDSADLKKIVRALSEEEKIDQQWEQFTKHFDNVHSDFFSSLKVKYPTLSPNELKLSAYLRMNLSTKEMAQLMNISVRGVEISRYRLRKKLGIPTEVNLYDFLAEV
jgi:DNA-binding CsgD family transcriptional regulator